MGHGFQAKGQHHQDAGGLARGHTTTRSTFSRKASSSPRLPSSWLSPANGSWFPSKRPAPSRRRRTGSGSYDHTIDLQSQGKLITSVAQLLAEPGEWVMVSKQKASTIKTPADWVGVIRPHDRPSVARQAHHLGCPAPG